MLDIAEIQKLIPQRYPFIMIDRVLELEPGKRAVAIKNVSMNEWYFSGHFPEKAVMPGVLIIEAMAQAAIILFSAPGEDARPAKKSYYLGAVKVRFLHLVLPGDQLKIEVKAVKVVANAALVDASAEVGGEEAARAEISFSIKDEPRTF